MMRLQIADCRLARRSFGRMVPSRFGVRGGRRFVSGRVHQRSRRLASRFRRGPRRDVVPGAAQQRPSGQHPNQGRLRVRSSTRAGHPTAAVPDTSATDGGRAGHATPSTEPRSESAAAAVIRLSGRDQRQRQHSASTNGPPSTSDFDRLTYHAAMSGAAGPRGGGFLPLNRLPVRCRRLA